ncbi:MAG: hypothetical protein ACFB4J_08985 [Elainellaceae cyanobacterium]
MNYVIAVFINRTAASAAQKTLRESGVPVEQVTLADQNSVANGDLVNSDLTFLGIRSGQKRFMTYWLVPFGFIGGYAFNLSTQYDLIESLGPQANHIVGGLLGAIAGFVGSLFTGSSITPFGKAKTPPYAKWLKQGKCLLIVQGAPNVTNKARSLLRQLEVENLESYVTTN